MAEQDGTIVSGDPCGPALYDGTFEGASATATADLASGLLKAYAILLTNPSHYNPDQGIQNISDAEGQAQFYDTLDILPIGAGNIIPGTAMLTLNIDGYIQGNAYIFGEIAGTGMLGQTVAQQYCNPPNGAESIPYVTSYTPCQLSIELPIPFAASDPTFSFYMILQVGEKDNGDADALNTAQAGLILPPGDTFTSASGVFLTQQGESTPEPASVILLSMGLAALAWIKRRAATPTV